MSKIKKHMKPIKGYKKISYRGSYYLVTLEIPNTAWVFNSGNRKDKSRCSKAKVLDIEQLETDGSLGYHGGYFHKILSGIKRRRQPHSSGFHRTATFYEVGKIIKPQLAFSKQEKQCASGIHYFRDKNSALTYY